MKNPYLPWLLVALFLLIGWYLRTDGNQWGLPFRLHPDEMKYVAPAARVYDGEWNPKYFRNPPGFSYLTAAWYPLWMQVRKPVEVPEWLGIPSTRLHLSDSISATYYYRPFDLVLGGRHLAALLGTLTLLCVFLLGRELGGVRLALVAAALNAISFISTRETHFAVNDASMAFFVTLTLYIGILSLRIRHWWTILLAGVLAGASVAMKYNAFPVVFALIALRYWVLHREEGSFPWAKWGGEALWICILSLVTFLLICPFPLTDSDTFWAEMRDLAQKSSQTWPGQETTWSGFLLLRTLWTSEGILSCLWAFAGLVLLIRQKKWEWLVFPALYMLLIASHSLYFMRFSLPLLPWMALFAAVGMISLLEKLRFQVKPKEIILAAVVLITLIEPGLRSWRSNDLFNQTDTRIEFLYWMLTVNRAPVRIAVDQYAVPLVYRDVAEPWNTLFDARMIPIDSLPSHELSRLDSIPDMPLGQVAVSSFVAFPGILEDTYSERRQALKQYLGASEPVMVFNPFKQKWQPQASDVEDTYNPVTQLGSRKQPGPAIEVFAR